MQRGFDLLNFSSVTNNITPLRIPVSSRQTEPFFLLFASLVQQFYRHQKVTSKAVKRNKNVITNDEIDNDVICHYVVLLFSRLQKKGGFHKSEWRTRVVPAKTRKVSIPWKDADISVSKD